MSGTLVTGGWLPLLLPTTLLKTTFSDAEKINLSKNR